MVERRVRNAKVRGSIPLGSTIPRAEKTSENKRLHRWSEALCVDTFQISCTRTDIGG